MDGRVFRVDVGSGAKIAQIELEDAKLHPEVKKLPRLLLKLLTQSWLDGPASDKAEASLLWTPCLLAEEVGALFCCTALAGIREEVSEAVQFWSDGRHTPGCGILAWVGAQGKRGHG